MRIGELGEFGLIERIAGLLPGSNFGSGVDVVVGIGDDVAVLDVHGPEHLLATCDSQVENVHFLRATTTPRQLGRKALAINISDIAAMGGTPTWALISLALPPSTEVGFVDELYAGLREQAEEAGVAIVGGNMSRIREEMVIDVTLLGKIASNMVLTRKGAREGDAVLVTGNPGDSRAGLALLQQPGLQPSDSIRRCLTAKHLTPQPRLKEGQALARSGLVHAMVDVSDGILGDIRHICRASGVGATLYLDRIPLSDACREAARLAGEDPLHWALTGGEDYELLFTASPDSVKAIQKLLRKETGTECRVIGRITASSQGLQILPADGEEPLFPEKITGWDHFSGS